MHYNVNTNNISIVNHPDTQTYWVAFYVNGVDCGNTIVEIRNNINYINWTSKSDGFDNLYMFDVINNKPYELPLSIKIIHPSSAVIILNNIISNFIGSSQFTSNQYINCINVK